MKGYNFRFHNFGFWGDSIILGLIGLILLGGGIASLIGILTGHIESKLIFIPIALLILGLMLTIGVIIAICNRIKDRREAREYENY